MQPTGALATLEAFRRHPYDRALGKRKDTLFELMEAVLVSSTPATLARLTPEPVFRRRRSSASDALSDGSIEVGACRSLAAAHLPASARPVWAVDGSTWPRPAAPVERTWSHAVNPGVPQSGIAPGWEYQWLVEVREPEGSWVLPLDVARRTPSSPSPTALAIRQLRGAQAMRPAGAPAPVATLDSNYDAVEPARAAHSPDPAIRLGIDAVVRLSSRRRFYREPPPYSGRGAPRKRGAVFRLPDPATHGEPDGSAADRDPAHGEVRVAIWGGCTRSGRRRPPSRWCGSRSSACRARAASRSRCGSRG